MNEQVHTMEEALEAAVISAALNVETTQPTAAMHHAQAALSAAQALAVVRNLPTSEELSNAQEMERLVRNGKQVLDQFKYLDPAVITSLASE